MGIHAAEGAIRVWGGCRGRTASWAMTCKDSFAPTAQAVFKNSPCTHNNFPENYGYRFNMSFKRTIGYRTGTRALDRNWEPARCAPQHGSSRTFENLRDSLLFYTCARSALWCVTRAGSQLRFPFSSFSSGANAQFQFGVCFTLMF